MDHYEVMSLIEEAKNELKEEIRLLRGDLDELDRKLDRERQDRQDHVRASTSGE